MCASFECGGPRFKPLLKKNCAKINNSVVEKSLHIKKSRLCGAKKSLNFAFTTFDQSLDPDCDVGLIHQKSPKT